MADPHGLIKFEKYLKRWFACNLKRRRKRTREKLPGGEEKFWYLTLSSQASRDITSGSQAFRNITSRLRIVSIHDIFTTFTLFTNFLILFNLAVHIKWPLYPYLISSIKVNHRFLMIGSDCSSTFPLFVLLATTAWQRSAARPSTRWPAPPPSPPSHPPSTMRRCPRRAPSCMVSCLDCDSGPLQNYMSQGNKFICSWTEGEKLSMFVQWRIQVCLWEISACAGHDWDEVLSTTSHVLCIVLGLL